MSKLSESQDRHARDLHHRTAGWGVFGTTKRRIGEVICQGSPVCLRPVTLLAMATVLSTGCSGGGRSDEFPRPNRTAARQSIEWLDGEGRPLVDLVAAARELLRKPLSAERCRAAIDRLEHSAPSPRMLALTARVTDEPLRAAFQSERSALQITLAHCMTGRPTEEERSRLRTRTDLSQRRLDQVRVAAR